MSSKAQSKEKFKSKIGGQAATNPASVRWTLVTSATPKVLDPHTIELTKEGKKLHLIIDSPASASFSVADNTPYF